MVSRVAGVLTGLAGLTVAGGWVFRVEGLVILSAGQSPMMFNTAVGFLLTAWCLLGTSLVPAGLLGLLGSATLFQYAAGVDLGIDQALMRSWLATDVSHPGRMGPNTAGGFLLVAVAAAARTPRRWMPAQAAPIAAASLAALASATLAAYAMGLEAAYRSGTLTRMAPLTALMFLIASAGLLFSGSGAAEWRICRRFGPAIAVGTAIVMVSLVLWGLVISDLNDTMSADSQRLAVAASYETAQHFEDLAASLARLGRRWSPECESPGTRCAADLDAYFHDFAPLESLEYQAPRRRLPVTVPRPGGAHVRTGGPIEPHSNTPVIEAIDGSGTRPVLRLAWQAPDGPALRASFDLEEVVGRALGPSFGNRGVRIRAGDWPVGNRVSGSGPSRSYEAPILGRTWRFTAPVVPAGAQVGRAADLVLAGGAFNGMLAGILVLVWQTARARALAQAETAAQLAAVLDAATGVSIISTDRQGLIRIFNRGAERMLGYRRGEVAGVHTLGIVHAGGEGAAGGDDAAGGCGERERNYTRKDGSAVQVLESVTTVRGPAGVAAGYLAVAIDISPLKDLERELRENNARLSNERHRAELANNAKSDFLARMSHEIRTPMNSIVGMSDLLWETPLGEDQREYVRVFRANALRLLELINDILDLSKVEAGELRLEIRPVVIAELVAELRDLMGPGAAKKNLSLEFSVDPGTPSSISTDGLRLRQIAVNLLSNAIKFTSAGSVSVRISPRGRNQMQFVVTDTGPGIQLAAAETIFDPFVQEDTSIARRHGGTGLGLAICRTLADALGGSIWLDTKPGEGSTFTFTVRGDLTGGEERSAAGGAAPSIQPPTAPGAGEGPLRLLIADDAPDNLILLQAYLRGGAYEVTLARNGVEAVEQAKAAPFDLILMDVQMPDLDGYSATREIREWERRHRRPRTPIIAFTAHALPEEQVKSSSAGCDGHLVKPIRKPDFLLAIGRYAGARPRAIVPEVLRELVPAFLESQAEQAQQIRDALERNDFEAIRVIGHNMRGSGGGYGFDGISNIGSVIESNGKARNPAGIREQLETLSKYLSEVSIEFAPDEDVQPAGR